MKTTKKDFQMFKKECQKWIDILGLKDWHFWYEHKECDENCIAQYLEDPSARACTIYFATELHDKLTVHDVKSSAFHEIMELYMNDLRLLARTGNSYERVDEATHRVVRMLENVLFPKY